MPSRKSLRRLAVLLLIILILALSVQVLLDHHVCSDHHCTLCQLIRSVTERPALIAVQWHTLVCILLLLFGITGSMSYLMLIHSPVQQKVKITS